MTLLTIVDRAFGQINLAQPASVVGSTDPAVRQMLAFASEEGKELARRFDWQILQKEGTFTTVATETQVAALTSTFTDFGHIINNAMWNRTQSWRCYGPLTPQQWQMRKASAAQAGIRNYFRIRGGGLIFNPIPSAGDAVYFEYISNKWCASSGGTAQADWVADTDVGLVDEEIIRLGIVWRYLKAKGLDYSEEFRTYELAIDNMFGDDAGNADVDMTGEVEPVLGANIPESNWAI